MQVTQLAQIIWSVSAALLVVLVMLHSPKGDGIGGIGGQAQLFTSTKSAEKTLNRITWTLSIIFIGLTIVLSAGWLNSAITSDRTVPEVVPTNTTAPAATPTAPVIPPSDK
jgi:preprotein translocase subunit SecG